jgi:hypothetical protein
VIEERLQVVPPTPPECDLLVDLGGCQLSRPRPTKIVERKELPPLVVRLVGERVAGVGDPPAKRARRAVDDDHVADAQIGSREALGISRVGSRVGPP